MKRRSPDDVLQVIGVLVVLAAIGIMAWLAISGRFPGKT